MYETFLFSMGLLAGAASGIYLGFILGVRKRGDYVTGSKEANES